MMIRCIILLLVWLLCFTCQSVESDGSCNGLPTFNCNYGFEGYSTDIVPPKRRNMSQGRPGKKGIKGEPGLRGLKGGKGESGQADDTRNELQTFKQAQNLMSQKLQNLTIQVQNLLQFQETNQELKNLTIEVQNIIRFQGRVVWDFNTRDCYDLKASGVRNSGVYNIDVNNRSVEVYCDMETDGGGWTVIQRRTSNAVNFYQNWSVYKRGFGSIPSNFWLGLDNIHEITSSKSYKLRVDLQDFSNNQAYASYSSFSIGSESSNYRLHVSGYSGNAGNSLNYNNNQPFTTKDRDNDAYSTNCAANYNHGAWWYRNCGHSNLNGKYYSSGVNDVKGVNWYYWKSNYQSLKRVEMKIRPN